LADGVHELRDQVCYLQLQCVDALAQLRMGKTKGATSQHAEALFKALQLLDDVAVDVCARVVCHTNIHRVMQMAMQATAAKSSAVWRVMVSSVEEAPEHLQQQSRG
tara:strand:+ start:32 stop:349 length:318 start_codon:yes stop_codon:yes gene_type:complete